MVPKGEQVLVHLEQGDGYAGHLKAGDVRTDKVTHDIEPVLLADLVRFAVSDVKLDLWCSAHAIDEEKYVVSSFIGQVADDWFHEHLDDLIGWLQFHALATWLAVDADSDLHFIFWQIKSGSANVRYGAGSERHAHAASPSLDLDAYIDHFTQ